MVISAREVASAPRSLLVDPAEGETGRSTSVASHSVTPRESFSIPCDSTDEITGQLAQAVVFYLRGQQLSSRDVGALRNYFRLGLSA
jgi:hypothetical protein